MKQVVGKVRKKPLHRYFRDKIDSWRCCLPAWLYCMTFASHSDLPMKTGLPSEFTFKKMLSAAEQMLVKKETPSVLWVFKRTLVTTAEAKRWLLCSWLLRLLLLLLFFLADFSRSPSWTCMNGSWVCLCVQRHHLDQACSDLLSVLSYMDLWTSGWRSITFTESSSQSSHSFTFLVFQSS